MPAFMMSIAVSSFLQLSAGEALRAEDQERLRACIAKIETAPEEAYEDGLTWQGEGNRPEARHCVALALIELGRLEEGATRLRELAMATDGGSREARAVYLAQAGNAWMLSRRPEAAELSLGDAISFTPDDPSLYADRARARMVQDKLDLAGKDLDQALALSGGHLDALKLRIELALRQNRISDAEADLRTALKIAPKDIDVLVLRGRVREAQLPEKDG